MLTPIEIRGRVLKSGMGYLKKQVDSFLEEICDDYETLYKENMELKDKMGVLSEGLQYYKDIEKTLQKALVLAEKTSEETKESARKKAEAIEKEAHANAKMILAEAKNETERLKGQIAGLVQQYEKYRMQFKQLVGAQMELFETSAYHMEFPGTEEPQPDAGEEAVSVPEAVSRPTEEPPAEEEPLEPEEEACKEENDGFAEADLPREEERPEDDNFAEIEEALKKQELSFEETREDEEIKETAKEVKRQQGALSDILERLNMKIAEAEEEPETSWKSGQNREQSREEDFEFLDND